MTGPGGRDRAAFRIPRVEFDLAGLLLGALLVVAYAFFWPSMASLLSVDGVQSGSEARPVDVPPAHVLRQAVFEGVRGHLRMPGLDRALALLGDQGGVIARVSAADPKVAEPVPLGVPGWKCAVAVAGLVLLWSVVGGALARVYALRKARDTPVPFDEALAFSCGSLRQFLQAPLFTAAAGALFVAGLYGCGAAAAIPWAGPVLQVVLQPLAFVAALVAAVIAMGLVLGYPTMTAAIAVERGGSLDAVSRTFSYVWTRPAMFGIASAIVLLVAAAIEAVSGFVVGAWQQGFAAGAALVDGELAPRLVDGARAGVALGVPVVGAGVPGQHAASIWVAWGVTAVLVVLVRGFLVSYVVGGFVDVYFLLREEVDQVDPSEVFVEGAGETLGDPVPGEPKQG